MNKIAKKKIFIIFLTALATTSTSTPFGVNFARRFFTRTIKIPLVRYAQRRFIAERHSLHRYRDEQPQQKQNSLIAQIIHKAQLVQKNFLKGFIGLISRFFVYTNLVRKKRVTRYTQTDEQSIDDYDTFIDHIEKQNSEGVSHSCDPSFVNKRDRSGLLPLDHAMNPKILQPEPNEKIIKKLIDTGANPTRGHIIEASPRIRQILFDKSRCPICLEPSADLPPEQIKFTPCCYNLICQNDLSILEARGKGCPLCRRAALRQVIYL